ncbi:hypothetical protein EDB92DRAFT_1814422 [Lactarius akahatsu]|uniref:SH3 domain-containing protein n=1 Tax=Lactarius akahatsu TaxID=416441 RepID=A0AAD4LK10_9AGAM|nr:hypothetical protein EDB92DRAFT_1814422 [Lactarius akahatsu]
MTILISNITAADTASLDDPNEISFAKSEVLDIIDWSGKWWQAQKEDNTVGIAPSNYLQIIGRPAGSSNGLDLRPHQAKALYGYTASLDVYSHHRIVVPSKFPQVVRQQQPAGSSNGSDRAHPSKAKVLGKWWQVGKEGGTLGIALSNYLQII